MSDHILEKIPEEGMEWKYLKSMRTAISLGLLTAVCAACGIGAAVYQLMNSLSNQVIISGAGSTDIIVGAMRVDGWVVISVSAGVFLALLSLFSFGMAMVNYRIFHSR